MTWKPRHEAHAIERVRLLFTFREPIPSRVIAKSSAEIRANPGELGFDEVGPAKSSIPTIKLQGNAALQTEPAAQNGFVMRRNQDGAVVEEVGFRDLVFGYMTKTYGRWDSLVKRLEEVLLPALDNVTEVAELDAIKLEYWDSFVFDGDPLEADVVELLGEVDPSIPEAVRKGSSAWHSHVGWFEGSDERPILINRNFDAVDVSNGDGEDRRSLGIYTLVENRSGSKVMEIEEAREIIEIMHNRSLLLFGETLSDEYREKVGIDLDSYK